MKFDIIKTHINIKYNIITVYLHIDSEKIYAKQF